MEAKLQSKIIKWLKSQGCYVLKTKPGAGIPRGCPDIIALYHDRYIAIEVKASATAPFQPGQLPTLSFLRKHNDFVYVAYPENWSIIQNEIASQFLLI